MSAITKSIEYRAGYVSQYRSLECPRCRNRSFGFAADGFRQCAGPRGCGHTWDPVPAGREVVGWQQEWLLR